MTDAIIISIEIPSNGDTPVMLVGRKKPRKVTEVINVFTGQEAIDIYNKLITVEGVDPNEAS